MLVLEYIEGTRIDRLQERLAAGELNLTRLLETVVDAYIKMMLEDGVFHADPHAGNLLVDPQGRLVLLDFGMVLQVERETRRRLIETVLAAARQDVDGVINGFYELGILDPDVDRGTVRDAAQSLMAISLRDDVSPRQIQRLVEQVLQTFYDWPLMLPSNLVYFGRAGVLVEGIGLRYDPNFNALAMARPVLDRSAKRLVQGVLEQDPRARLTDWTQEALTTVRTVRDSSAGWSATSCECAGIRATPWSCSASWPSRCGGRCWRSSPSRSPSSRASSIWRPAGSRCWCSDCSSPSACSWSSSSCRPTCSRIRSGSVGTGPTAELDA